MRVIIMNRILHLQWLRCASGSGYKTRVQSMDIQGVRRYCVVVEIPIISNVSQPPPPRTHGPVRGYTLVIRPLVCAIWAYLPC